MIGCARTCSLVLSHVRPSSSDKCCILASPCCNLFLSSAASWRDRFDSACPESSAKQVGERNSPQTSARHAHACHLAARHDLSFASKIGSCHLQTLALVLGISNLLLCRMELHFWNTFLELQLSRAAAHRKHQWVFIPRKEGTRRSAHIPLQLRVSCALPSRMLSWDGLISIHDS